jgi:hypothetical protein
MKTTNMLFPIFAAFLVGGMLLTSSCGSSKSEAQIRKEVKADMESEANAKAIKDAKVIEEAEAAEDAKAIEEAEAAKAEARKKARRDSIAKVVKAEKLALTEDMKKFNLSSIFIYSMKANIDEAYSRRDHMSIAELRGHLIQIFSFWGNGAELVKAMLAQPAILRTTYNVNKVQFVAMVHKYGKTKEARSMCANLLSVMKSKHNANGVFNWYQDVMQSDKKKAEDYVRDIDFNYGSNQDWKDLLAHAKENKIDLGDNPDELYLAFLFEKRRRSEGGQKLIDVWVEILTDLNKRLAAVQA